MIKIFFIFLLGLFVFMPAYANDDSPIVLELFTSQSCSSCPPADRVLGELSKQPNIIALSCNVTYWNHLHWKDTLSKDFCTSRQRDYVQVLQSRGPYTPQIVINGRHELVGSQAGKIEKIINNEKNIVKPISIYKDDNQLEINLPEIKKGKYIVSLLTYGENHTQAIKNGENKGRTILYTNPVTDIESLGEWNGDEQIMTYDISKYKNSGGIVILAQTINSAGAILAAGKINNQ